MSLSEQTSRVANGGKNALKALIEKLGGTVPETTKIDGYSALIDDLFIGNCQLNAQTYTGTGENGPVVYEFPYRPMAVMIMNSSGSTRMFSIREAEKIVGLASGAIDVDIGITWGDRSISIGSEETIPKYCCNVSGMVYWLIAFLAADE